VRLRAPDDADPQPRRLHPAAIVVDAVGAALRLATSVVVVAVVGGSTPTTALAYGAAGIAISVVGAWLGWRRTMYWLDDVALHMRSGVLTPDERIVPRARVQAVDTGAGLLQRLFGVVQLRVQTPGAADEDEIVLTAVTHAEAARLRRALGQPEPAAPDERVRLGMGDLLLAALTGPQLSAAVSAVAGGYALFDNVVDVRHGESLLARLDTVHEIALAVAVALTAAYLLSFAGAIVAFAGFQAERDRQVLRIHRGLLARRAQSIPLARIDGVIIVEGLLRAPLGLAALRIETAAYGGERAAGRTLLPLVRRRDAEAVIARLVPALAVTPGALQRPPPRALRRFVLQPSAGGALAGTLLALALPAVWPAVPALALAGAVAGLRAYRAAGLRLAGEIVVVRESRLARRTLLARRHRLQEHELARTPLQARARLADLGVTVGSGGGGRARHLDAATAETAFTALRR
jgi:putative membrane protein